ncbi:polysaccharide pyruvyl transferase family protein [Pseudonocardia asaccharolytica]|uniref:Membrane protein n=1 Tax=Pseudonocardia asaccharolytica DSM 44247 = NBRC 16224 TaxID=1123024 RepID=A0A511D7S2_9PSEU|nr:polysaccharide pyruvyl transferase family protein [Pseudonocardia asaccharolytica]GEL20812.1 membrane protein [Pseudonocardia asaccharolytica DSM 44247 = NBRC 16224]
MSVRGVSRRRAGPPRIGLFGLLGSGNIGNDGSLEAVVNHLRENHPDAVLGGLCAGPERVSARWGIPATPLHWYDAAAPPASGIAAAGLKVVGKGFDAIRTAAWARRFDIVIVPGMGVLEATLPLRPWGFPYALLLLCASGRLFGTKIALVSVGSAVITQRPLRLMVTAAARLAHYRSYRDIPSRDALRTMGVDTSADEVYPDLVFALPMPCVGDDRPATGVVGVGVMDYRGGNADRNRAEQVHAEYLAKMKRFTRWLIDNGRSIRLVTGDRVDAAVTAEIVADLRTYRPDLAPSRVVAEPVSCMTELMEQLRSVDTVIATRYHNVLCALRLSKPTISVGYATKNEVLMSQMGLGDFCQSVDSFEVNRLIEQFCELEDQRERLSGVLARKSLEHARRSQEQLTALSRHIHTVIDKG